jgi:hypothetical protein
MSNNVLFGYEPKLPDNIRDIFMWLCQDVASLRSKWGFYCELFGTQENAELLSELVQASFQIIEESLRKDMIMAICRLSDPPQSMKKDNLSFPALFQQLDGPGITPELFKDFQFACKPVRKYRNKRVGHNDLNTRIKPLDNPLPGIGRKEFDQIVQLAEQVLNAVYQRFDNGELIFTIVQMGGGNELMFWLKTAKEYADIKKKRFLDNLA